MRNSWFGPLALVAVLAAVPVSAQEAGLFDRLDKNADGSVSADEVDGRAKRLFERLLRTSDKDEDGKLSKEEFSAGLAERRDAVRPDNDQPANERGGALAEERFKQLDANGDGKLSQEEAPERIAQRFERIDANKDGSIDKEEFLRLLRRPGRAGEAGAPPRRAFAAGAMVLRALDADGDGELSASEIADASKALAKLDKNDDGKLDRDELLPPAARRAGPDAAGSARRLREADKNGDGKLSKEEAPERLQRVFDRIDANSDGQLDAGEMRAFFERQ